jgi:hypothetical protein
MAKDGDSERALRELRRVFSSDGLTLRSKAHYDIGTLHAQEEREDEAIEEMKWALRLDSTDMDAKHNLEVLVRRKLQREEELRRQQQQQQQQQPGQPGDQEGEPSQQDAQPGQEGQPDQPGTPSNESGGQSQPTPNGPRTPPSSPQALSDALDAAGTEIDIEDALRILDALRDRERQVQSDLNRAGNRGTPVEKDW